MLLSARAGNEALVVYGFVLNMRPILNNFIKRVNRPTRKSATERRHETEHEEPKSALIKAPENIVSKLPRNRQRVKGGEANEQLAMSSEQWKIFGRESLPKGERCWLLKEFGRTMRTKAVRAVIGDY
jgi:hypothetical protein